MLKVKYEAHRPVFSAVSSAFTIDIQSKLQPDSNEMTAAYMRILIHAVDSSLFPDADLDPVTWTGPLPRGRHGQVSALCESRDGIREYFDHFESVRSTISDGKWTEVHFQKPSGHFTEVKWS